MLCVLRIAGDDLDIDAMLPNAKLSPFRIDRKGEGKARTNALNYDVAADTESADKLFSDIRAFLLANRQEIAALGRRPGVQHFILDIAVSVAEEMASRSLVLSKDMMSAAVELGLSFEISIYR